jgi:hypothetical protein
MAGKGLFSILVVCLDMSTKVEPTVEATVADMADKLAIIRSSGGSSCCCCFRLLGTRQIFVLFIQLSFRRGCTDFIGGKYLIGAKQVVKQEIHIVSRGSINSTTI